ncbi:MAG: hypothetical protein ACRCWQ_02665 [Bacilli bacterium]
MISYDFSKAYKGVETFGKKVDRLQLLLNNANMSRSILAEGTDIIQQEVAKSAPIRTGHLRGGAFYNESSKTVRGAVEMFADSKGYYYKFQNYGFTTKKGQKIRGSKFVDRAVTRTKQRAYKHVIQRYKEEINRG